ncbi:hypothetical protein RJ640_024140 [Escallonia rubra]|uniref:Secreted protein n=1 Tax=Escallonia rubra TaxID=112253 RepID=A0AA88R2X4_9ASTE|nr:hypothetical protein RJ640_024140 [Escallonia rubra]
MAEPIAVLICSLFAPMASATFAHSAATRAAAEATTASLLVVFEGTLWFEFSAAAIAAKAAATPATDIAACTSALCNLWSSFRFCLISLSHFFIETCLNEQAIGLVALAVRPHELQSYTMHAKEGPSSRDELQKLLNPCTS